MNRCKSIARRSYILLSAFFLSFGSSALATDYIGVMLFVDNSIPFKDTKPPRVTGYFSAGVFKDKDNCEVRSEARAEELFKAAVSNGIQVSAILSDCLWLHDYSATNEAVGFTVNYPRVSEPEVFSELIRVESFERLDQCEAAAGVISEKNVLLLNVLRDYYALICKSL